MTAYRFCRSDDMSLLVEAYERCRGQEDEGEPALDREGFKRLVRDLDLWCSSCMVAFDGSEPVGVLFGAKRSESTLVYALRVHPEHRRQGHGRHLLTSLSQKLAILGPPNLVAEVPAGRVAASSTFLACGWKPGGQLCDWRRDSGPVRETTSGSLESLAQVGVDDLLGEGLLGAPSLCWQRDLPALVKQGERLRGLAFHSPDRIEAWVLWEEGALGQDWPIFAAGARPEPLGRLGLRLAIEEVARRAGVSGLVLGRVALGELETEQLVALGFERRAEYLRFTNRAQAA